MNKHQRARDEYEYEMFVSYCRRPLDIRWARWIQANVERFHIPRRFRGEHIGAGRFRRVFRDEDEMAASPDISAALDRALCASRFLLVVCTPATPKSEWITKEVRRFCELRGPERILLVVDGDPRSSFPLGLAAEPVAADARPGPGCSSRAARKRARIQVLASVLGCTYDDLRQRERERGFSRLLALSIAMVFVLAMFSIWLYISLRDARNRERAAQFLAEVSTTENLTASELRAMEELRVSSAAVRISFLRQLLNSPGSSRRFLARSGVVLRSLVGPSSDRRREMIAALTDNVSDDKVASTFTVAAARLGIAAWLDPDELNSPRWEEAFNNLLIAYRDNLDVPSEHVLPLFRTAARNCSAEFVQSRSSELLNEIVDFNRETPWRQVWTLSDVTATLVAHASNMQILATLEKVIEWLPEPRDPPPHCFNFIAALAHELSWVGAPDEVREAIWQDLYAARDYRRLALNGYFLTELMGDRLGTDDRRLEFLQKLDAQIQESHDWTEIGRLADLFAAFAESDTGSCIPGPDFALDHIIELSRSSTDEQADIVVQLIGNLTCRTTSDFRGRIAALVVHELEQSDDHRRWRLLVRMMGQLESEERELSLPWRPEAMTRALTLLSEAGDRSEASDAGRLAVTLARGVPKEEGARQLGQFIEFLAGHASDRIVNEMTRVAMTLADRVPAVSRAEIVGEISKMFASAKPMPIVQTIPVAAAYAALLRGGEAPGSQRDVVHRLLEASESDYGEMIAISLQKIAPTLYGEIANELFLRVFPLAVGSDSPATAIAIAVAPEMDTEVVLDMMQKIVEEVCENPTATRTGSLVRILEAFSIPTSVDASKLDRYAGSLLDAAERQPAEDVTYLCSAYLRLKQVANPDNPSLAIQSDFTTSLETAGALRIVCCAWAHQGGFTERELDELIEEMEGLDSTTISVLVDSYLAMRKAEPGLERSTQDARVARILLALLGEDRKGELLHTIARQYSNLAVLIPMKERPWSPEILQRLADRLQEMADFPLLVADEFHFLVWSYGLIASCAPSDAEMLPGDIDIALVRLNRGQSPISTLPIYLGGFLDIFEPPPPEEVTEAYRLLLSLEPSFGSRTRRIADALPECQLRPQVEMVISAIGDLRPTKPADAEALLELLMHPVVGLHDDMQAAILECAGTVIELIPHAPPAANIWRLVEAVERAAMDSGKMIPHAESARLRHSY